MRLKIIELLCPLLPVSVQTRRNAALASSRLSATPPFGEARYSPCGFSVAWGVS
jgi:hypothetical protein